MAGFDINDRLTWAWITDEPAEFPAQIGDLRINPSDRGSFYQMSGGVAHFQPLPAGMAFDPRVRTGVPEVTITEAEIYDWVVANGLVQDQR